MSTTASSLLAFFEELRSEGVAVGTSEILDAFAALDEVSWTDQRDFRESLAATIAKSQEDRRIFELLFDRHFFRAAESEALERGMEDERFECAGDRIDLDELREAIRRAITEGNDGAMRDLARLAMNAFGRQGERSGVIGVDVQRIRRALGLQASGRRDDGQDQALDPENVKQFERYLRRELERATIERTGKLPPSRPLAELDRTLPTSPAQDLAAVHRAVAQLKRRIATLGHEARGRARGRAGRRATHHAGLARDRRRAAPPAVPAEAPAPSRDLRPLRRLDLGELSKRLLPLRAARAARLVPQAAQLRLHRADQRGHRHLRARARLPEDLRARLFGGRRRRRLGIHGLRQGLDRVRRGDRRGSRPPLDRDRPGRRPHQRPRAARRQPSAQSPSTRAAPSGSTPSRSSTGTTATR